MQQALLGKSRAMPGAQATARRGAARHALLVRAAKLSSSNGANGAAPAPRKRPEYHPGRSAG